MLNMKRKISIKIMIIFLYIVILYISCNIIILKMEMPNKIEISNIYYKENEKLNIINLFYIEDIQESIEDNIKMQNHFSNFTDAPHKNIVDFLKEIYDSNYDMYLMINNILIQNDMYYPSEIYEQNMIYVLNELNELNKFENLADHPSNIGSDSDIIIFNPNGVSLHVCVGNEVMCNIYCRTVIVR